MADLTNASQEVEITDQSTGYKCNPLIDGVLPITLVGVTGTDRINPAREDGNLITIADGVTGTQANVAKLNVPLGTTLGSTTQVLVGGSVTTNPPTYINGRIYPLNLTPTGSLRVESLPSVNLDMAAATASGYGYGVNVENLALTPSGSFSPVISLRNPIGSGRKIMIHNIASLSMTPAKVAYVQFRHNPTFTVTGTTLTAHNLLVGSTASSSINVYSDGTVTGGSIVWERLANDVGFVADIDFRIQVLPGNDFSIFANPNTNNLPVTAGIHWAEVPL